MADDTTDATKKEALPERPSDIDAGKPQEEAFEELVETDPAMLIENMADMTADVIEGRRLFVVALDGHVADYLERFMQYEAQADTRDRAIVLCIARWQQNHQYRANDMVDQPVPGYAAVAE